MLNSAHQGYIYQDIFGAYFVAQELSQGRGTTKFHFDHKKTPDGIPDKFDDLIIYNEDSITYIQIKHSNDEYQHALTKSDFSSNSNHNLAIFDLFETWKALHKLGSEWRVCLAWDIPESDDLILKVLIKLSNEESILPGSICYKFDCNKLWPEVEGVLSSWRALREKSKSIDRQKFKAFLDCLVVEVNCPKSSLLTDYTVGLEKLLYRSIENIGIGIYPNDHLGIRQVAESLCTLTRRRRATSNQMPISCDEIAKEINIKQTHGGIEQKFPVDKKLLVFTPNRIDQVVSALKKHRAVVLTAEPGAGKSWFIENLQNHLQDTVFIKHYCYVALEDPLALKRITVNVLYGSLITQILQSEEIGHFMTKRYASNLEQLNILLGEIKNKTLLIIDGIDHIWRVYQNNRGGLTEDETKILQALSRIELKNTNVSLLILSQPIEQLKQYIPYHNCILSKLPESFIEKLIERNALQNFELNGNSLAKVIYKKCNGNALYGKYLIDNAVLNKIHTSFRWIEDLPQYDYNLSSYYYYVLKQIEGDTRVSYALCGADFSLTEAELIEITHLGANVSKQLKHLRPILKHNPRIGYSIYHESFKRFIIDKISEMSGSINELIYIPLIAWLKTLPFYQSIKSYGHLLKLYFEIGDYKAITDTISIDFFKESLFYAQPLHNIRQNHYLQRASLKYVNNSFSELIIVAEQSKIQYELDNMNSPVLISYLLAIQKIHDEDSMYRVFWDDKNLLIQQEDALEFLVCQAYEGDKDVHWSLIPELESIPYNLIGMEAIKLLNTKQYGIFDEMIRELNEDNRHKKALIIVIYEVENWCAYFGDKWTQDTPYFKKLRDGFTASIPTLEQAVNIIISNDRFINEQNWEEIIRDMVLLVKKANKAEIQKAIAMLSDYNWFRNWLIYLIKITELSQRQYTHEEVVESFTYLVRDLEPFKGTPRACDLFSQLSYIKKSYKWGLLLCNNEVKFLITCSDLLEKVIQTSSSIQRSYSGPLTVEEYLDIITYFLPPEHVINKYDEYYESFCSTRVYPVVAELSFKYASLLSRNGKTVLAKEKYMEGIQSILAYGFRADRTLSELLDCSVSYQKLYGTLDIDRFYELYQMATTVITHTDGKSTSNYSIEWFNEFIKVFPDESLKFLVSRTIEKDEIYWQHEEEFNNILEEQSFLFTPTQWFLLCRSLPLASSTKSITQALHNLDLVDKRIKKVYSRWVRNLPNIKGRAEYSKEICSQFKKKFDINLLLEKGDKEYSNVLPSKTIIFSATNAEEILVFLEDNNLVEDYAEHFKELFMKVSSWEKKKEIIRQVATKFRNRGELGGWIEDLFDSGSKEWLYLNICLFVYVVDSYKGLGATFYIERSYKVDPKQTINMLKEILGYSLFERKYSFSISSDLINAFVILQLNEEMVQDILKTTYEIIKYRLPHPPDTNEDVSLYVGLDKFSRDELVICILISRLKTLSTDKTQGIIWSLSYLAQTSPELIFKPYYWAFSHTDYLLPVHRAVLLQILKEYVDKKIIPETLIGQLLNTYPTGFFLEDQYIRSFVEYAVELDEESAKYVQQVSHAYDEGFFSYIHPKYLTISSYIGILKGTYKSFAIKRDNAIKKHKQYYSSSQNVSTPYISFANIAYEIINSQYYAPLKKLTKSNKSYICNLGFLLDEIVLQIGALTNRPSHIPTPIEFPKFEVHSVTSPYESDGWTLLALKEMELFGGNYDEKKTLISSLTLTYDEEAKEEGDFYSKYTFNTQQYNKYIIEQAPTEKPICILSVDDMLELSSIVYVSPNIIRDLKLSIDFNLHNGFQAHNEKGEAIIKIDTWKEDYYGSISSAIEVPRLKGVAVFVRSDHYKELLAINKKKCSFVLSQETKIK